MDTKKSVDIACCLIVDKQNRILLLRRHPQNFGGGLWAPPGGKQEVDEEAGFAALRETAEETGIRLESADYLGMHEVRMPHGAARVRSFVAYASGDEAVTLHETEHDGYGWFSMAELVLEDNIIWGLPTTLLDLGLIETLDTDPTLADGSEIVLLERNLL